MDLDGFWKAIDTQLEKLRTAKSADDVILILASPDCIGDAFFAGGGGDGRVQDSLLDAGWATTEYKAWYYWVMKAPNGDKITYIEGDIYRGDVMTR